MADFVSIAVTLALSGIAGIVWLVRLEGRVDKETALRESQIEGVMQTQRAVQDQQRNFETRIYEILERIQDSQERLESKMDSKADRSR